MSGEEIEGLELPFGWNQQWESLEELQDWVSDLMENVSSLMMDESLDHDQWTMFAGVLAGMGLLIHDQMATFLPISQFQHELQLSDRVEEAIGARIVQLKPWMYAAAVEGFESASLLDTFRNITKAALDAHHKLN
jgi:hypothetical protein